MKIKAFIASISAALLTACGSVEVNHYAAEKPELELSTYFNGTLDAWGIFQKRDGTVARRFHVVIEGTWKSPTAQSLDAQASARRNLARNG